VKKHAATAQKNVESTSMNIVKDARKNVLNVPMHAMHIMER